MQGVQSISLITMRHSCPSVITRSTQVSLSVRRKKNSVPSGTVSVSYKNTDGKVRFEVSIPDGVDASFLFKNKELTLPQGKNEFVIEL